jgi:hypothetical protein
MNFQRREFLSAGAAIAMIGAGARFAEGNPLTPSEASPALSEQ